MPSPVFFLTRHGQTDWNAQKRLQGSHDIPLNETGREQARRLRPFFDGLELQAWFSSPLSRARETLAIATGRGDENIIIEPDLREVALGPLEGLTQEEVIRRFGVDIWSRWAASEVEDFAFVGAESPIESNARLRACLLRLAREHPFSTAVACTHGFLLRRFLQDLSPTDPPRIVPNGLIVEIRVDVEREKFELLKIHQP